MKVAIVSQYYKPEAVPIPADLAEALTERGHQVRVVTGFPHYPAGRVFEGYRQRFSQLERDGLVHVMRVPSFISHSQNAIGRILNYVSFGLSSLTAGRHVRGADVIYVYATPMTAAMAPSFWRWTRAIPFVLHVQDVWPESITGSNLVQRQGVNGVISAVLRPWLSHLYRSASATIAIAPTMSETLQERGLPVDKSRTVFNWGNEPANPESPARDAIAALNDADLSCTVMYAGNIGELQDLETVIRAARAVQEPGFRLVICGTGVALPRLRGLATDIGADNVEFWDAVGRERLAALYEQSDFQIVSLKDLPIFRGTVPSKFQASLAFGVPVITTVRGDVEAIVEAEGLGFTAAPEDPVSLEGAFRRAFELKAKDRTAMASRARDYYYSTMSREAGVSRIESILLEARRSSGKKGKS
jgi:colanic acid biosynthesis glycosyl transferase WcaI